MEALAGSSGSSWCLMVFFKDNLKAISGTKAPSQRLARALGRRAAGQASSPGPVVASPWLVVLVSPFLLEPLICPNHSYKHTYTCMDVFPCVPLSLEEV